MRAKLIYDDMYKGASSEVKKNRKGNCRDGSDYEGLGLKWNKKPG